MVPALLKLADKMHAIKMQLPNNQKTIKYNNALNLTFNTEQQSHYLHFFIQSEESGYHKVLGNKRVSINDWNDSKKERSVDIDLEGGNTIQVTLKCNLPKKEMKKIANEYYAQPTQPKKQMQDTQQWQKSLRDNHENKSQTKPNERRSPQPFKRGPMETKPTALDICKQQLQQSKVSESEEDEYEKEQFMQILSPRTQTPIPMPVQYTPESAAQRVKTDTTVERSQKRQPQLTESKSQSQSQSQQSSDDFNNEITSSIVNRLSNIETLINQKLNVQDFTQMQTQHHRGSSYQSFLNVELIEDQLYQYKQMIKELALLLDVNPDTTSIVMAVQRLVQKCRGQSESILKLQCDTQIFQQQLQSLTIQQALQQEKQSDLSRTLRQKLNIYENLFEENVKLKNLLKQDLQRIVELNIELKKLKQDSIEQMEIEKKIGQLNLDIEQVSQDIDEKRYKNLTLNEELFQLQQLADESITSDRSN